MKKNNFSHGTPEQMLDAFEDKLYELEDGSIEMSTDMEGEFLDDSEYIDDDLYDINGEELDVDVEGCDINSSDEPWRDIDIGEYTEEPYLEEMAEFLADHPGAEEDAKNHFGVDRIEDIDEGALTSWFIEHDQLWEDLQRFLKRKYPEEVEMKQQTMYDLKQQGY